MTNQTQSQLEMNSNLEKKVLPSHPVQVIDLPTPVNWHKFKLWLKAYNNMKLAELVSGFRYGFRLGFTGHQFAQDGPNLQSAFSNNKIPC